MGGVSGGILLAPTSLSQVIEANLEELKPSFHQPGGESEVELLFDQRVRVPVGA